MDYVIATDGGEIWTDFYAIPKNAPHLDAAYAFINFMQDPFIQAREASVHGYAPTDSRALALQPDSLASDPILHPAENLMNGLEFGAAQTLTDPIRAEVMARFKSA
jgi:spermidine/putrescine transport system substrate-binding protein